MATKRTQRLRTSKAALATPAARPARQRIQASTERTVGTVTPPTSGVAARGAYVPDGSPGSWGGSSTPDASGEIGTPGNLNVFGFLTGEDYNQDLDGFPMFGNYNKMRLSDAQVNATLLMLKLPLKGGSWVIKPASEDPQDLAIADFVQANLIDDDALLRSWQHVLDNAMLKFDFGCAASEIIWGLSDDRSNQLSRQAALFELASGDADTDPLRALDGAPLYTKIVDLAPRLPRTFYRWVEDQQTGRLKYLQQFAPKFGQYGYWNIPAERLAVHVRNREGNAYYGRSVLRTAYPHWWWKQQLYRIGMVSADREHAGIARAALGERYQAATAPVDKIEATVKAMRVHDRAYLVQPYGVEYDWLTSQGTSDRMTGLVTFIEHHNLMIARNILQSFSAQGEQRHGSFGAARVTVDVYFDALAGEANEIGSELKQHVIKPLCDRNFNMTGRTYPRLECADISTADLAGLSEAFAKLAEKKIITPDDGLEEFFRDLADAPPLPDDLKNQDRTPPPAPSPFGSGGPQPPTPPTPPKPGGPPAGPKQAPAKVQATKRAPFVESGRSFGREPTALERRTLELHAMPARLDSERDRLVRELASIRQEQLTRVAARIAQKDSRPTGAFTDLRPKHVPMPLIGDLATAIKATQQRALTYGREQVRAELKRQGADVSLSLASKKTAGTNQRTAKSHLVSSAEVTAQKLGDAWQGRILDAGLRQRRTGLQGDDLKAAIINDLRDEAESGARRDAAAEVNEAFGIGRALEAGQLSAQIESCTYSAILDANTCDPCAELDGQAFEIDSDEYEQVLPPYKNCEGRDACRCVLLYIAKDEAAA